MKLTVITDQVWSAQEINEMVNKRVELKVDPETNCYTVKVL
jgi:hypothetical protein